MYFLCSPEKGFSYSSRIRYLKIPNWLLVSGSLDKYPDIIATIKFNNLHIKKMTSKFTQKILNTNR